LGADTAADQGRAVVFEEPIAAAIVFDHPKCPVPDQGPYLPFEGGDDGDLAPKL
jgi:hypothetical protein